jgi:hypothetical protein
VNASEFASNVAPPLHECVHIHGMVRKRATLGKHIIFYLIEPVPTHGELKTIESSTSTPSTSTLSTSSSSSPASSTTAATIPTVSGEDVDDATESKAKKGRKHNRQTRMVAELTDSTMYV